MKLHQISPKPYNVEAVESARREGRHFDRDHILMTHIRNVDTEIDSETLHATIGEVFIGLLECLDRTNPGLKEPELYMVTRNGTIIARPIDGKIVKDNMPNTKKDRLLVVGEYKASI